LIIFKHVKKSFGDRHILKDVNLKIVPKKTTVIFGMSGGGKSTIIKHIVRLLKPDSGSIEINGVDITKISEKEMRKLRRNIGFLFQSGALFDSMNVFDNIAFPLREHYYSDPVTPKQLKYSVEYALDLVGLSKDVLKLASHELSGGMKKRVGLARTIVSKPSIILYDEPTSGLDPISSSLITNMINNLQEELQVTSVLISHDIKESFRSGNYFAFLYQGFITEYGNEFFFKTSKNKIIQKFIHSST